MQRILELEPRVADIAQATGKIFVEAPANHPYDRRRQPGRKQLPVRLAIQNRRDDVGGRLAVERSPARQHLEHHTAERPDVRAAVDDLAAGLLRAHVRHSAENDVLADEGGRRLRQRGRRLPNERFRQSKIEHLHRTVEGDFDVRRFQIAVNDPLFVRRFHGCGDLMAEPQRVADAQPPGNQSIPQRLATYQLHHEKRHALRFVQLMDRRDMGMAEGCEHVRLAAKAGDVLGVVAKNRADDLQRHVATEIRVPREVDFAHAAFAQRGKHFVGGEP